MDPVRTTIMNNRFSAIVEEAASILYRTAHTTFVKLVQDFQCALATVDGDIFAYPSQSGVAVFIGLPLQPVIQGFDKSALKPGDVFIMNDPFSTEGVVTHLMDVTMIRPIFVGGELVAFGWSFVHASDIGGAVPGSISPAFKEVFQEGLRVRPCKLYDGGVLNTVVRDMFMDNSRIPEEIWGDFQAMLAALHSMDKRLNELCTRYGADGVLTAMQDVLELSEMKARAVVAALPDGHFSFGDYLEGFGQGEYSYIHVAMTIESDNISLDFKGTDPQVPAAYNIVSGPRTHPYIVQALLSYILTVEPDAPRNAGLLRPIRTEIPKGSIINANFPAAGGSRVASATRVYDALIGCLNQALPNGLVAAGSGMAGVIVVTSRDPMSGRITPRVINPLAGGSGARNGLDGVDGVDVRFGALRTVPAEMIEVETVMLVREYGILVDSRAPGKFTGGAALVLELENTGLEATMTVRGMNRFHFQPWGVKGGHPGRLGEVIMNPGKSGAASIGKIEVLHMGKGDVVRMLTPSGGGYGNPLEREIERIAADMKQGFLSRESATRDFGIVFNASKQIDTQATERNRARLASDRAISAFNVGAEREAYDRVWPAKVRARLATKVLEQEFSIQSHLLAAVRDRLSTEGLPVSEARLEAVFMQELRGLTGDAMN
jgi:N-methylhydantoinase B